MHQTLETLSSKIPRLIGNMRWTTCIRLSGDDNQGDQMSRNEETTTSPRVISRKIPPKKECLKFLIIINSKD